MPKGIYKRTEYHRQILRNSLSLFKKGEKHWNWKGGILKDRGKDRGYVMIYMPEHPSATKSHPYIYEHRLVIEKHLGRYLQPDEVVHHMNGIRDDNRIENLEFLVEQDHNKLPKKKRKRFLRICPKCGHIF